MPAPVPMTPLRPSPLWMAKPWGGRYLTEVYGAKVPEGTGEAWLVSSMAGEKGTSVRGVPLARLVKHPLPLVKTIDSTQALSVQLHPDDAVAQRLHGPGHRGKIEAWYFLRAPVEGFVYHGLRPEVRPEDLLDLATRGRSPEDLLQRVAVRSGDVLVIEPGCVHALTAGAVVVEVQTPSDLTYRLYDWGRVGTDGRPRQVHIEECRAVLASPSIRMAHPGVRKPEPVKGSPGRYRLAPEGVLGFELLRGREGAIRLPSRLSDRHALVFVALDGAPELRSRAGAWSPEVLAAGDAVVVLPGAGEILVGGQGDCLVAWLED